jgi:hypothetical protein
MKPAVVIGVGALVIAGAATAQIHKCVDASGKTTFSQTVCAPGQSTKVIDDRASRAPAPPPASTAATAVPSQARDKGNPTAPRQPPAPTSAVASHCRPLPPAELVARRRDVQTALGSHSNSPERTEALRLESRFLEMEEQYDMLPSHLAAKRADENTRVTSIVGSTRQEALVTLRQIHQLRWDWDEVSDPTAPGGISLLCRNRATGEFGPDERCACKPKVAGRWKGDDTSPPAR